MRILICGDRNWIDKELIHSTIKAILDGRPEGGIETIIEGDARGADRLAGHIADELGISKHVFPAKWGLYGRAAGPIRNTQMREEGHPDLVVAFHDDIENSKGTKDMLKQAKMAGIPTNLISHNKGVAIK